MDSPESLPLLLAVFALLLLAAICSGLNIAIMALDLGELKRKAKLGNKQAKRVLPLRKNVHLTLGSILFTNVAAASGTALVLGSAFSGLIAGLISTLLLVIFGEVMPQALFGKDPLKWTNRFYYLLIMMRFATYIVSKPLQILLDKMFPHEKGTLHSRHELGLLIHEHGLDKTSELDEDEVEIIKGALQLSEKRVRDIYTDIRHTFWLAQGTQIDSKLINEIKDKGYSRIPIFNKQLTKCYGILLIKDLLVLDFDENSYLVDDLPLHPVQLVGSMTALDTMFRKFINAHTHLIPIEKDDVIIGVVTIEDLIEEILGHEIEDETDFRKKQKRTRPKLPLKRP
jgi:metal transporter CNNM